MTDLNPAPTTSDTPPTAIHALTTRGSVIVRFSTARDATLARFSTGEANLTLAVIDGAACLTAVALSPDPADATSACDVDLDMEDTVDLRDGSEHVFAWEFGDFGTRLFLDGYQVYACASNLSPARLIPRVCSADKEPSHALDQGDIRVTSEVNADILTLPTILTSTSTDGTTVLDARAQAPTPKFDITFAGPHLAAHDDRRLATMDEGTIWMRFRVRGPRQYGTILSASRPVTVDGTTADESTREECLSVSIDTTGITYRALVGEQWHVVHAAGSWDDGRWHEVAIRAHRGAIDLDINGWNEVHAPGQFFFAHTGADHLNIGQDTQGVRLMGEVRCGGIAGTSLSDGTVAMLSHRPVLLTTALMDAGYAGSASYRIPSTVLTTRGTLIAGADQRVVISNDAPNHIRFVIRRSEDGGVTWGPLQTVVGFPGEGVDGASVIDSCLVVDRDRERIIVLIDYFPGGIGLPNNEIGLGVDPSGRRLLRWATSRLRDAGLDGRAEGEAHFVLGEDGHVLTLDGEDTPFTVDENGNVWEDTRAAGNIHLKDGICAEESILAMPTSLILEFHSDDDGLTWSAPRPINHMVKEPWMHFMGTTPGAGIQLRRGAHRGRLLMPYYFTGQSLGHYSAGALISDDGGETWRRGGSFNDGRIVGGVEIDPMTFTDDEATTHETTLVEREDGTVLALIRNQNSSGYVARAESRDGGETWGDVWFDDALPEIFSLPAAVAWPTLSEVGEDGTDPVGVLSAPTNRIVFANASQMLPYRGRGVVRVSVDGGKSWAVSRCINPWHYVYQSLVAINSDRIGVVWERETHGVYITILDTRWFEHPAVGS